MSRKSLIIILFVLLVFCLVAYFCGQTHISLSQVENGSYQVSTKNLSLFSLYRLSGYIYKTKATHLNAAYEFIRQNPQQFSGVSIQLVRSVIDDKSPHAEHYFFQQTIDGIPVYGSAVVVHLKNNDEIYAATGNIIIDDSLPLAKILGTQAVGIALTQAEKDSGQTNLLVAGMNEYALNLSVLGRGKGFATDRTEAILIISQKLPLNFATEYFVDLANGKIIYQESQIEGALNRLVYNCHETDTCAVDRTEGQTKVTDSDVNNLYSILGRVYAFYYQHFDRESFDNHGAILQGYVHRIDIVGYPCPNAAFVSGTLQFCDGMVAPDLVMHELTHGVTKTTAGLIYSYQSGALNESMSDIFATAMTNNWELAGDVHVPGLVTPVRYLDDPTKRDQPDRLFSPFYACGTNDAGGLHANTGVVNKAFYLMTEGGDFNNCHMQGIGRDKSYAIEYRALTRYLTPAANFKDMYIDLLLSCNDLYSADSTTCKNVKIALESTELDQEPPDDQNGPICESIAEQVPACSKASSVPTMVSSPVITVVKPETGNTLLPAPTGITSNGCKIVSHCQSGGGSLQMCTFTCE